MCIRLLNTCRKVLQASQKAKQCSPKMHVLTLKWLLWPRSLSERHLFREPELCQLWLSCILCILQRHSETCETHKRQRATEPSPKAHKQCELRNPALFFLLAKRFLGPTNRWKCYFGSNVPLPPHALGYFIQSVQMVTTKSGNFYCHWQSCRRKRSQLALLGGLWGGTFVATQAYPGISSQFGKESRANGFSVYKPAINHTFKSSHLKSLTNQSPSCSTESLLSGKHCTKLLAGLMTKVDIYGKYAGGYLCSVNPSAQTGGWCVLYQSCSCSGRQHPEMISRPRTRLQM